MSPVIGLLVALGVLVAPLAANAQQPGKIPRIGILASIRSPATEGFERGLRELGYVEGKNILIKWRLVQGKFERLPEYATELVRLKVDVIVAPAEVYVRAAQDATKTVPIVFALVSDPVAVGFVKSLARPAGNITGLSSIALDLQPKRLELLREAVAETRRIAVLTNLPASERDPRRDEGPLRAVQDAARSLGVQIEVEAVQDPGELDSAFAAMRRQGAGAILELPGDPMFYAERRRIADLAIRSRLPMMCAAKESVEAGCLMFYGASYPDLIRRSAVYVDKIVKGAKPADLPVEQPTRFELIINLKAAKAIGLTIPRSVLLRADEIIQ